jgi:hypothetical protein
MNSCQIVPFPYPPLYAFKVKKQKAVPQLVPEERHSDKKCYHKRECRKGIHKFMGRSLQQE